MTDVLQELGATFLGSRLKRLGERLQAGATRIAQEAGVHVQPAHVATLAALEAQPLTVGQLAQAIGISQPGVTRTVGQMTELGLVQSEQGDDARQRTVSLSPAGAAMLARARLHVWPRVEDGVKDLFGGAPEDFLARIAALEALLDAKSLDVRAAESGTPVLAIREFSDELAAQFHAINVEWISAMYRLEATDLAVLENPRASIIERGGAILFVEARGLGIVGTCALQKTGASSYELTKMGVLERARGLKAGEFLLHAMIERAAALGADPLYLLSNTRSAAAIHLYEKAGFVHDADIMARYGARYERCNVAMLYRG